MRLGYFSGQKAVRPECSSTWDVEETAQKRTVQRTLPVFGKGNHIRDCTWSSGCSRDFVDLASHVSEGYSGAEDVFGCGTWYQSFLCGGDSAHLIFYGSALYEADKFDGYFK